MFFIKAETQGFGFFVAGKPCAGGMVEENLRLFSISLFAFPFLLFPALFLFPTLLSLFFSFLFPFLFLFLFLFSLPFFRLPFHRSEYKKTKAAAAAFVSVRKIIFSLPNRF